MNFSSFPVHPAWIFARAFGGDEGGSTLRTYRAAAAPVDERTVLPLFATNADTYARWAESATRVNRGPTATITSWRQ